MSDEPTPSAPPAAPEETATPKAAAPTPRFLRPTFGQSLSATDPVSIGALATAVLASVVSVVQTGFMWEARNDEIEAALRAQQLRACVAYDRAGATANARAQVIAAEAEEPEAGDDAFEDALADYQDSLAEMSFLMPKSIRPTIALTQQDALAVYEAYFQRDFAKMADISSADSPWADHDAAIQDACERVIRTVRDR